MDMSREVNLFFEGLGFGEGPRWHEGRLWFSDFILNHVASVDLEKNFRVEVKLDDRPSGLGWLPDGRLLIVSMFKRQIIRQDGNGELVVHADISDVASFGANDMVVGLDGTAYIGNLGSDLMAGEPLTEAKLAIVHPDGSVSALEEGMFIPNGSVIPPAGDTLIVGESGGRRYLAFPIRSDGFLGESRVWADLGEYSPDGCSLDAEGAIWFADPGSKKVGRVLKGARSPRWWTCPTRRTPAPSAGRTEAPSSCSPARRGRPATSSQAAPAFGRSRSTPRTPDCRNPGRPARSYWKMEASDWWEPPAPKGNLDAAPPSTRSICPVT